MRLISFLKEQLILIISKIKLLFTKKTTTNIDNITFENTLERNIYPIVNDNRSRHSSTSSSITRTSGEFNECQNQTSPRTSPTCLLNTLSDSPNLSDQMLAAPINMHSSLEFNNHHNQNSTESYSTCPLKTLSNPSNRSEQILKVSTNIHSTFGAGSFDHNLHSVNDLYNLIINKLQRYMKRSNLHQLSLATITEQLQHMNIDLNELTTEDLIEFKTKCLASNNNLVNINTPLASIIEDFLLNSDENYAFNRYKHVAQKLQAHWETIHNTNPERVTLNSREVYLIFKSANMDLNYLSLTSLRMLQDLWRNDTVSSYNQFVKLIIEQKISSITKEKIKFMASSSNLEQTRRHNDQQTEQQVNLEDTNINNDFENKSNQVKYKLY